MNESSTSGAGGYTQLKEIDEVDYELFIFQGIRTLFDQDPQIQAFFDAENSQEYLKVEVVGYITDIFIELVHELSLERNTVVTFYEQKGQAGYLYLEDEDLHTVNISTQYLLDLLKKWNNGGKAKNDAISDLRLSLAHEARHVHDAQKYPKRFRRVAVEINNLSAWEKITSHHEIAAEIFAIEHVLRAAASEEDSHQRDSYIRIANKREHFLKRELFVARILNKIRKK